MSGTSCHCASKSIACGASTFQVGFGVAASDCTKHLWPPASAEPSVPSIWIWIRSSRFTRVAQDEVTCASAPLSNSKVANTSSSTSTSYGCPASSMRRGICVTLRHDTALIGPIRLVSR